MNELEREGWALENTGGGCMISYRDITALNGRTYLASVNGDGIVIFDLTHEQYREMPVEESEHTVVTSFYFDHSMPEFKKDLAKHLKPEDIAEVVAMYYQHAPEDDQIQNCTIHDCMPPDRSHCKGCQSTGKPHHITTDDRMNPALKAEIGGLRGGMLGAAEKVNCPDRFTMTPDPDNPAMFITDTTTGRKARVSLYAYGAVREVLAELFGQEG